MIRILELEAQPVSEIFYQYAGTGGRTETGRLQIEVARATGIPASLDGLLVASDLQGIAPSFYDAGATDLLGVVLVEHLSTLASAGLVPQLNDLGAILAGDLFSEASARKRGATGDVAAVWDAFDQEFAWVVGVAGNHDEFLQGWKAIERRESVDLLDGDLISKDGFTIGGVSKIAGNSKKKGRREPDEQMQRIRSVLRAQPDVLVLHEGPDGVEREQRGNSAIREELVSDFAGLVICGHVHWSSPLADFGDFQVLNADTRAFLLLPS
ncbi:MAG: metallophosphoesterase [Myxococcota bacterium]